MSYDDDNDVDACGQIRMSGEIKNLAPALVEAQAEIAAVNKSSENKFDHYTYANLNDYVRVVKPVLQKHGLAIVFGRKRVNNLPDRTTRNGGTEYVRHVEMLVRVLHKSGEWIEFTIDGEGQDRADKAIYKAVTGARKYGIAAALDLATSDDPEADETTGTTPAGTNGSGRKQPAPPTRQQQTRPAPPKQPAPAAAAAREVVNEETGEVTTAAPGDNPFADDAWFRREVLAGFDLRGFTAAQRKTALDMVLGKHNWKELAHVPLERRRELRDKVINGDFDHLKTKKGSEILPPANAKKTEAAHA